MIACASFKKRRSQKRDAAKATIPTAKAITATILGAISQAGVIYISLFPRCKREPNQPMRWQTGQIVSGTRIVWRACYRYDRIIPSANTQMKLRIDVNVLYTTPMSVDSAYLHLVYHQQQTCRKKHFSIVRCCFGTRFSCFCPSITSRERYSQQWDNCFPPWCYSYFAWLKLQFCTRISQCCRC